MVRHGRCEAMRMMRIGATLASEVQVARGAQSIEAIKLSTVVATSTLDVANIASRADSRSSRSCHFGISFDL